MAAQTQTPPAQNTYLTPMLVENLLSESREQFVEIVKHLPSRLRSDFMRESGFMKTIVLRGPSADNLRLCHPKSLIAAFVNMASLGLTLNPIKKHGTIIPRYNKDGQEWEAHNLIMYQGLIFLATQAGVKDIVVEVVYAADEFSMERTHEGDRYRHKIEIHTPRGATGNHFLGVYVAAKMPGSNYPKVEWIPREDIFKMRDASDSYKDKKGEPRPGSPWVAYFDEMAKKSGIKRASKRWEEDVEQTDTWNVFKAAVERDNEEEGLFKGNTYEGTATEPEVETITLEQAAALDTAMKSAEMKPTKILDAYKVDELMKLPATKFEEAMGRVKTFGEKKAAAKKEAGK